MALLERKGSAEGRLQLPADWILMHPTTRHLRCYNMRQSAVLEPNLFMALTCADSSLRNLLE